jgi:hypothetical protein
MPLEQLRAVRPQQLQFDTRPMNKHFLHAYTLAGSRRSRDN